MQATSGTLAMNVTIYRKLPYDPVLPENHIRA
jgi:hypothetical protein